MLEPQVHEQRGCLSHRSVSKRCGWARESDGRGHRKGRGAVLSHRCVSKGNESELLVCEQSDSRGLREDRGAVLEPQVREQRGCLRYGCVSEWDAWAIGAQAKGAAWCEKVTAEGIEKVVGM